MIRVRHPNGYVTTYLHMRGPSPLHEGDEVTNETILGSVGSTGRSTGPHVDFSVKDGNGREVNPEQVTWANEALPSYTPQRHDLDEQYARARVVATRLGLNSRQYDQLLRRIDQQAARDERLVERQQDETDRQVLTRMAALDQNLTSISQIPNYGNASPRLQMQIQDTIRQNTRAAEPPTNSSAYLDADDAAYGSPDEQQAFLRINVRALPVTRAEQAQLQRRQNALRADLRNDNQPNALAVQLNRVDASLRRAAGDPDSGFRMDRNRRTGALEQTEANRRRFAQLRDQAAARVEAAQRTANHPLSDTEIDGVVHSLLLTATVATPQGVAQQPIYEALRQSPDAQVSVQIPHQDYVRIRQGLMDRGNPAPTDAQIIVYYQRSLQYRR